LFDHVYLRVRDLEASRRFYEAVLRPLGFPLTTETAELVEFGALSLSAEDPRTQPLLFAFLARTREAVAAFHRAGIEGGYPEKRAGWDWLRWKP
jgi:catechol 2,3-dioxygenase-like lactoylglutathione lyase family enzyme